jgi:methylmalonyl-CoA mutase
MMTPSMSELNFDEFNASTAEQWLQLVQKELADRPVDALQWCIEEGVSVGPYQTAAEHEYSLDYAAVTEQYQLISHSDPKQWNRIALESLMGGTNALGMDCESFSWEVLPILLQGIEVQYISVHFVNMSDGAQWADAFAAYCDTNSIDKTQLSGSFEISSSVLKQEEMRTWYSQTRAVFPRFRIVTIDAACVHEQGGSLVQELSWALVSGHANLLSLLESGVEIDEASACMQFNFATGSSYFPQIAKLRAFRWMWKRVIEAYKPVHACSVNTFLLASTSRYLQTAKDKHNNLLRATTQTMSAYVGGANSVSVLPYNSGAQGADESALRWARNIQQLLLEESYFAQFKSAADGAYYIEELTGQLVSAAWKQFQALDAKASERGLDSAWQEFRAAILSFATEQQDLVKEGKRIIVGVNRYVNKTDNAVVDDSAQTLSAPMEKA